MAEYHVGCGVFGIYAGTLNKRGDMWLHKSDVTDEVLGCAAQHLLLNGTEFRFQYKDKSYVLKVESGEHDQSEQPVEDIGSMCSECDAWNKYKNYSQPEYEQIPAGDVALKSSSCVFKSPMWWFDVLAEIEKSGYVICKKTGR